MMKRVDKRIWNRHVPLYNPYGVADYESVQKKMWQATVMVKNAASLEAIKQGFASNIYFRNMMMSGKYYFYQNRLYSDIRTNYGVSTRRRYPLAKRDHRCLKKNTISGRKYPAELVNIVGAYIDGTTGMGPGNSFGEYFTWLMDEKYKISKKELADLTGIDERTITRMRTTEGYSPSLVFVVVCCIAMSLLPWESDKLIELAGYKLRSNLRAERGYIALIHVFYQCTITECDELCELWGISPISSVIKSKKKNI